MSDNVVAGRSCGGCTLCCKLIDVPAVQKPALQWCKHCVIGEGCGIHKDRPSECRAFNCAYLVSAALDERWKPVNSKFVVAMDEVNRTIYIYADAHGNAWRKEPSYSQIRKWAQRFWPLGGRVLVWGREVIAVLPDREVNLGAMQEGQRINVRETATPLGSTFEIELVRDG
ncbi:MAG: hypothetical protein R3C25_05765 [Hyphomonadaceae bacterium]